MMCQQRNIQSKHKEGLRIFICIVERVRDAIKSIGVRDDERFGIEVSNFTPCIMDPIPIEVVPLPCILRTEIPAQLL